MVRNSMKNRWKLIVAVGAFMPCLLSAQNTEHKETKASFEQDSIVSVVDLGFGIVQTSNLSTAAVSSISGKRLQEAPVRSMADALYGRLLGLNGKQTTTGANFTIRGLQTITDNGIIVLVDGLERPIDMIRPEEVESVSILKDAAAIALYGYRGINGVVNIKTKRGTVSGLQVNASYEHIFTTPFRLPKQADAYDYATALNTARLNDGLSPYYNAYEVEAFRTGDQPFLYPDVDWKKLALREHGNIDIYHLDFNGGGEKMKFFAMFNLQNDNGLLNNSAANVNDYSTQFKNHKANIRTNLDISLGRNTKLELGLLGVLGATNRPHGISQSNLMSTLYRLPSAAFPVKTEDGIWGGDTSWGGINPIAQIQATGYDQTSYCTLLADAKITQGLEMVLKGLSTSVRIGFDNYAEYMETRQTGFEYNRDRLVFNEQGSPIETIRGENSGNKAGDLSFNRYLNYQWRRTNLIATLDYAGHAKKHRYNASLIYSFQNLSSSGQNNTFYRHNLSTYLHYDYSGHYMVDFVLVGSGSNRSCNVEKYALSPTLSLGWILSEEAFFNKAEWIDFLKMRISAGILHNDYVPSNDLTHQNFASGSGSFVYGTGNTQVWGVREGFLPTRDPKLERAFKYNFGVDASFWNSLSLTFDAYWQRRDRIFVSESARVSSVLGVQPAYVNAGKVDSYGAEVGVAYEQNWGDWRFHTGGTFSFCRNEIKEMYEQPRAEDYLKRTGKSVGQYFGLEAIGFFQDELEIEAAPLHTFGSVRPGDVRYKDQNKDGVINENDEVAIGYNNMAPELNYSFNIGLEYKGLGFDALFQGVGHNTAYLSIPGIYQPLVDRANISKEYLEHCWMPDGSRPNAKYPRLTSVASPNNYRQNSIWLQDASFLKLRYLDVYYKLPKTWTRKMLANEVKIYLRGMNLLSWDGIKIMDPEAIDTGMPTERNFSVGVSVNF